VTLRPRPYIKLVTDGILLTKTQGDRELRQYNAVILDEAHERSLNIDFLIGYLKQLLPRSLDLKLVVTSATIDAERFSGQFANAPVIDVSGWLYRWSCATGRRRREKPRAPPRRMPLIPGRFTV
jgi:ATP-dependent helicase HrpA